MPSETKNAHVGLRTKPIAPPPRTPGPRESVAYAQVELGGNLEGWTVDAEFLLRDGCVVHGPVTFTPPPAVVFGSLSYSALRRLSLHEVHHAVEDTMRQIEAAVPRGAAAGWVDALTAGRRPGRRGQDPAVYLLWAQRRVEAEQRKPDRPIKWMVEQWGDLYSEGAINKYVYMAREKGFLPPRGEPVELTEQAKRLLKGDTDGER